MTSQNKRQIKPIILIPICWRNYSVYYSMVKAKSKVPWDSSSGMANIHYSANIYYILTIKMYFFLFQEEKVEMEIFMFRLVKSMSALLSLSHNETGYYLFLILPNWHIENNLALRYRCLVPPTVFKLSYTALPH